MSLKYKLLIVLLVTPILSLVVYKSIVTELFRDDKISYVFDTIGKANSSKVSELRGTLENLNKSDLLMLSFFDNKTELKKLVNNYMQVNENYEKIVILTENKTIIDIDRTNLTNSIKIINSVKNELKSNSKSNSVILRQYTEHKIIIARKYKLGSQYVSFINIVQLKNKLNVTGEIYNNFLMSLSEAEVKVKNNKLNINKKLQGLLFDDKELISRIFKNKFGNEVLKKKYLNKVYLISYSKVGSSHAYITLLPEEKAMSVITELENKSLIFLVCIISCAGLLSLLFSRKLTKSLSELVEATNKIRNGNYNISLKIKSKDEVGTLSSSFIVMVQKINKLLAELKKYNENLEEMVRQRTEQLNNTLRVQKAMTDSLSQGLVVFKPDGVSTSIFSKATTKIFNKSPKGLDLHSILNLPEDEKEQTMEMCFNLTSESLPFDDLVPFMPEKANISNKHVSLEYLPIRNNSGAINSFVMVATDSTSEIEAQKLAQKEREMVETIIAILKDRNGFLGFIDDAKETIGSIVQRKIDFNNTKELEVVHRKYHTLKGRSGYYHLKIFVDLIHSIEDVLQNQIDNQVHETEIIEKNNILVGSLEKFCEEIKPWFGHNPWSSNYEPTVEIEISKVKDLSTMLKKEGVSNKFQKSFLFEIASNSIGSYFAPYLELVQNLTKERSLSLEPIESVGMQIPIIVELYDEMFSSFVHIFRNIVSHGFSDDNLSRNKISISCEIKSDENQEFLEISIGDNGNGIDTMKIKSMLAGKNIDTVELSDFEINQFIFKDNLSTSESIDKMSGRGVGLSAVKEEVEKLHGKVTVHSELGIGTTFCIYVPYRTELKGVNDGENECKLAS